MQGGHMTELGFVTLLPGVTRTIEIRLKYWAIH